MAEEELVASSVASPTPADHHKRKLEDLESPAPESTTHSLSKSISDPDSPKNEAEEEENGGADVSEAKRPRLEANINQPERLVSQNGHQEEEKAGEVKDDENELPLPAVEGSPSVLEAPETVKEALEAVTEELDSTEKKPETEIAEEPEQLQAEVEESSKDLPGEGNFPSADMHTVSATQIMSRHLEVPNDKVGVLIGKAGDTIRSLQDNSGAKIQITKDADADPRSTTRPLELIGTLESIIKAEKLIKDVIAEADAGGSPSLVARGFSTVQAAGGGEQLEIQVPFEKVGLIIGKGGETIRNLQTRSGARIQLIQQNISEGDQSRERTVRVSGNKKQIEEATEMINDVMNQFEHPTFSLISGSPQFPRMADTNGKRKAVSQEPKAKTKGKTLRIDQNKGDMISELPDDILIRILSRLNVEEATVTSILSTRWRHLCTYITHLHFQPLKLPNRIIDVSSTVWSLPRFLNREKFIVYKELSKSVDWISHVLDCYNGGHVLKEFRVNIPWATQLDVENWLGFALSREVETIYIHLDIKLLRKELYKKSYQPLPYRFKLLTKNYSFSVRNLILDNGCRCFTSLKTLYLHNVELHVLEVELMLSKCVVLDTLSITNSLLLGNVIKIGGPSLKLKHLEITYCCPTIHIHDLINLVSFSFTSFEWVDQKIVVENVPSLTDLYWAHMSDVTLMSCLHQLVKLTLGFVHLRIEGYLWHPSLPKLMNLKYLVLMLDMFFILEMLSNTRILKITTLIEACPFLEKLDVQFSWWWKSPYWNLRDTCPIDENLREYPHNNLKQVKFCNYLGSPCELEVGLYILKNAMNIEEFIIEPCATLIEAESDDEVSVRVRDVREEASARAHKQFQARVPKSVKLIIL